MVANGIRFLTVKIKGFLDNADPEPFSFGLCVFVFLGKHYPDSIWNILVREVSGHDDQTVAWLL